VPRETHKCTLTLTSTYKLTHSHSLIHMCMHAHRCTYTCTHAIHTIAHMSMHTRAFPLTHMRTQAHTHSHICIHALIHTHTCTLLHSDKHGFMHICVHTGTHVYTHIHIHALTYVPTHYIHTYLHSCTQCTTHVCTQSFSHTHTHYFWKLATLQEVQAPQGYISLQRHFPDPNKTSQSPRLCTPQPASGGLQSLRVGHFLARLRWPPALSGELESHRSRRMAEQVPNTVPISPDVQFGRSGIIDRQRPFSGLRKSQHREQDPKEESSGLQCGLWDVESCKIGILWAPLRGVGEAAEKERLSKQCSSQSSLPYQDVAPVTHISPIGKRKAPGQVVD
jgi:hypothetical protein